MVYFLSKNRKTGDRTTMPAGGDNVMGRAGCIFNARASGLHQASGAPDDAKVALESENRFRGGDCGRSARGHAFSTGLDQQGRMQARFGL